MPRKNADEILSQAKGDWRRAYAHWRKWRTDAKEDYAFVAGDQWDENDRAYLDRQGRPVVSFNRVAPTIDAVSGSEVTNRQEIRYIPREIGDARVNEAFTAAAKYFRDLCDAEDEESSAFYDCLICGIGWTETRLDHSEDPDGQIVIERVDPFEVFADPAAKRGNLEDAQFVFRVKDLTKSDVEREWPGATDRVFPGAFSWGDVDEDDEDPHEVIHGRQYETAAKGKLPSSRKRNYRVVEYQWKEWKPVYRMIDPQTGNESVFDERRYGMLKKAFKSMGGDLPPAIRQKRVEVRRAFFLGDDVLEEGAGPCKTDYTYKAVTGKRDRNEGTFYGLVRPMKDPQRWANKFFSQILHIINSNAKGGLLAETDAFEDVRKAEESWAEADSIVWMKTGGIGRVSPKPMAGVPPDVSSMMQFCVQSMREVTGVNLEMLGMAEAVQPGVLEYQRRQSGLMILATMFDALRRYRKGQGRLMLYLIQEYIPEGKLIRVQGQAGAEYVPLMKVPDTIKFDVVVDEAPSSPNMKEQVFAVLQVLVPQLTAMGIQMPADALDYLPLPESLVQSIKNQNMPQEGQQAQVDPAVQVMQQQMAIEQQKVQSEAQIAQQKMQSEAQTAQQRMQMEQNIKQQQLEFDNHLELQKLQFERERADVEHQVMTAKLQLEQFKTQAMLNKVIPGATSELEQGMEQLGQTVADNHSRMQSALTAAMQHLQATQNRQDEFSKALNQMQQSVLAPREIVRDEMGRVKGSRIVTNGNGTVQ